jgi:hypothetical protein
LLAPSRKFVFGALRNKYDPVNVTLAHKNVAFGLVRLRAKVKAGANPWLTCG